MNSIASGNNLFFNFIIVNNNGNKAKFITFYKTHSGIGLLISFNNTYLTVANDDSTLIGSAYRFPSSKSNCTILNKWHVISVTWFNGKNPSNCWSNGEELVTFYAGNSKGTDHCIVCDLGKPLNKSHLTGCIGEIIGFYRSLTDMETSHIHQYLMKKWT